MSRRCAVEPSPAVAAKAQRLLAQRRVLVDVRACSALVSGDHGVYRVEAWPGGVVCSCPAGGSGRCSHAVAAMVAWAEQETQR